MRWRRDDGVEMRVERIGVVVVDGGEWAQLAVGIFFFSSGIRAVHFKVPI